MTAGLRPEILQDAKNLILRGWCKGELALDEGGRPVGQNTREACAWCLVGAISAAMQRAGIGVLSLVGLAHWDAVSRAIHGRPGKGCGIAWWQDRPERTRDEVVAVLDKLLTWARRRADCPTCSGVGSVRAELGMRRVCGTCQGLGHVRAGSLPA